MTTTKTQRHEGENGGGGSEPGESLDVLMETKERLFAA